MLSKQKALCCGSWDFLNPIRNDSVYSAVNYHRVSFEIQIENIVNDGLYLFVIDKRMQNGVFACVGKMLS